MKAVICPTMKMDESAGFRLNSVYVIVATLVRAAQPGTPPAWEV